MQEWLAEALAAEARTAILVTHDVEEALYLSDRVLVLSSRPARAVAELAAPEPRALPRLEAITAPEFTAARERAMAALREGS
jgi:ABC-type nitrate/sulfonate/bicarbonate transport system ATPase subunit